MSDVAGDTDLLHASTRRSRRPSVIWLIPIVAVAIGAWLAWDTLSREGPTITVTFETAEGLQASQSQLKYRDIVLGTVQSLALSDDHSHVVVKVSTTKQADPLLNSDTQFWVVKPRLFAGTLSGLSTLVSGSYIGMLPGQATTTSQARFRRSRGSSRAGVQRTRPHVPDKGEFDWARSRWVRRSSSAT